jgi:hypothetical protein
MGASLVLSDDDSDEDHDGHTPGRLPETFEASYNDDDDVAHTDDDDDDDDDELPVELRERVDRLLQCGRCSQVRDCACARARVCVCTFSCVACVVSAQVQQCAHVATASDEHAPARRVRVLRSFVSQVSVFGWGVWCAHVNCSERHLAWHQCDFGAYLPSSKTTPAQSAASASTSVKPPANKTRHSATTASRRESGCVHAVMVCDRDGAGRVTTSSWTRSRSCIGDA